MHLSLISLDSMSASVARYSPPGHEAARLLDVARMLADVNTLDRRKKQIYSLWILGYLRFLDRRDMGAPRPQYVRRFLNNLDERRDVDAKMRRQATEAIVFFHECVLHQSVSEGHGRLGMLSHDEKRTILAQLHGPEKLLARIVFATELDLGEALRLRVGDVDMTRGRIVITDAQGRSNRIVHLGDDLTQTLETHLERVHRTHQRDLADGHGAVDLPPGVQDQFPGSESAWMWQWVFPSERRSVDLRSGDERRYPLQPVRLLDALDRRTAPETRMMQATPDRDAALDQILPPSLRPSSRSTDRAATSGAAQAGAAQTAASSTASESSSASDDGESSHWSSWKPVYA